MLPLFLIIIFSLFVFRFIKVMLKNGDDLHALAFLSLYIYTVFAQIGYAYFPEISDFVGAYFGLKIFYKYWAFMFFSFVFTFIFYKRFNSKKNKKHVYTVKPSRKKYGLFFFYIIVISFYLILNFYFINNRELFGYGGGKTMGGPWFGIGFLIFQTCTFILFTLFRDKTNNIRKRIFSFIIFVFSFFFFLQVTVASGSRSHLLYFFIAIAIFELSPIIYSIKHKKRNVLLIMLGCFVILSFLSIIRTIRTSGSETSLSSVYNFYSSGSNDSNEDLSSIILLQDYYLPSHTLFVSMHHKIIDPIEVLKSNFANALILFDYPFLTTTILDRGLRINNERGVGWAYHYFVEGYNALGFLGIFYNALLWNLGLAFWVRLSRSNNIKHNAAMFAISALMIVSVMKTQNSAFIRNYWLILLPALGLLLLANNSKIIFYKRKRMH